MLPRAVKFRAGMVAALLPGLLGCAALLPGCFSSCTGKGAPPAPTAVQTPPSPMPAPAVQTPVAPPPGPAAQTPAAPPAAEHSKTAYVPKAVQEPRPGLTLDGMRSVKDGMTFQEVRQIIGDPGTLVAGTDKASTVYRWNEAGLSFLARFEDGKLTRKSIISAEGGEVAAEKAESKTIDKDLYDGIRAGMTFEEVMNHIGIEAQPISGNGSKVVIYTWRDATGSSFTARFEDGKLVRKTGLYIAKAPPKGEGESGAEGAPESATGTTGTDEAGTETAKTDKESEAGADTGENSGGETGEAAPPGPRKSRVTVAGATRREREAESGDGQSDRSYRPKAQLPRNMRKLRDGSYEIRIHNTAESRVKAAVVSQEGAAELTIPSGGTKSVLVNQGDYTIQFIYDDDPYTLHKGGNIPIGQWLTDMEVFLFGGSYDVQVLDRSTDTPSSWNGPPRP